MKLKKIFPLIVIVIGVIAFTLVGGKDANDYIEDKQYIKAYEELSKIEPNEEGYKEAQLQMEKIKPKVDSLKAINDKAKTADVRAEKIDYALTRLKMTIKENMKDPDSFEMLERIHDDRAKGDTVGLIIEYRGNNSYGGKVKDVVFADYILSSDEIVITEAPKR